MNWYFAFFFLSGFCSILYELVWLRLSVAQYGVTIAMSSIVLSVFMAGMGAGSWIAGRVARRYGNRHPRLPLRLYATTEFLIGCASIIVPLQLRFGPSLLESLRSASNSSFSYYLGSGIFVAVTLIPWCACMGATIPFAMWAIRSDARLEAGRSFSFLYTSNVLGAILGAIIPLGLIEIYGFHGTLRIGTCLNAIIALSAFALTFRSMEGVPSSDIQHPAPNAAIPPVVTGKGVGALILLFLTGFATMGMEVVWIRLYTAYIGPLVYSFALILASYLVATLVGSLVYRSKGSIRGLGSRFAWVLLGFFSLLPLITADPRLSLNPSLRVIFGIVAISGVIGYLTPSLVDYWSGGDADRAAKAYAINVLGCILGPLFASFILLPYFSERFAIAAFAIPWFVLIIPWPGSNRLSTKAHALSFASAVAATLIVFFAKDYSLRYPGGQILRDSTATVIAAGTGMDRKLVTNGIGMTSLTPITKMMVHFPLASLDHPPHSVLVICFGMGTTFRSALSWGVPVTAVELVPSVPKFFTYYHEDGDHLMASPLAHVVIDDGRRFLSHTDEKFDLIIIDPPPPVSAAASSLLYSEEFYALAKKHLQPGGILAQWLPDGDNAVRASVTRALVDSFSHVQVYDSVEHWGWHFFASMDPIPARSAEQMLARMPAPAVADMMEWGPAKTPQEQIQLMLSNPLAPAAMMKLAPSIPALRDDRPVNEYFLVRQIAGS